MFPGEPRSRSRYSPTRARQSDEQELNALHVTAFARNMDRYAPHRVDQNDLAGQATCSRRRGRQIEHIFFMLACSRQFGEIIRFDDDMTGRAGHLALARPFQRLTAPLSHIKQDGSIRRLNLLPAFAIGAYEGDANQAGAP